MKCPNCQMNISDNSKWCLHCGMQFNQAQCSSVLCPNCKSAISAGTQICPSCGYQSSIVNQQFSNQLVSSNILQQNIILMIKKIQLC